MWSGAGPFGNLFISDCNNGLIREVGTNGIITTVAGTDGPNYPGGGGSATNAILFSPSGVAVDATGNLFIADHFKSASAKWSRMGLSPRGR